MKTVIECKTREEWLEKRKEFNGEPLYNASEVSAYIGDNPYRSAFTAWQEKTGQKEPEDLSNNENIKRGIEREPSIREHFIEENKDWFQPIYKPYDIYVWRGKYYNLGATLDCEGIVTNANNPYGLPVGTRVVIEFKSVLVTPQIITEENWMYHPPVYYIEQQYAQLMATLYTANILCAEFTHQEEGKEPWYEYRTYAPIIVDPLTLYEDANVKAIDERLQKFVQCVKTKTAPDKNIQGTDLDITFSASVANLPIVLSNKEQLKNAVIVAVSFVKDLEISEENEKEVKTIRASVNKMKTSINQKRLEVKHELEKPINQWDSDIKEITAEIDKALNTMDTKLREIEDNRIANKKMAIEGITSAEIQAAFVGQDSLLEYFNQCGGVVYDARWENRTTTTNAITKDIKTQIEQFKQDFDIMSTFSSDSEIYNAMLRAYKPKRKMSDAINARADVEQTRRIQEQARQEQAMKKTLFDEPQQTSRPTENTTIVQDSFPTSEDYFTIAFTMYHVSRTQLKALAEYMTNNRISYKRTFAEKENN